MFVGVPLNIQSIYHHSSFLVTLIKGSVLWEFLVKEKKFLGFENIPLLFAHKFNIMGTCDTKIFRLTQKYIDALCIVITW